MCLVCSHFVEMIKHLFAGYWEISHLWRRIAIWWDVHILDPISILLIVCWADTARPMGWQYKAFDVVVMIVFLVVMDFSKVHSLWDDFTQEIFF